MGSDGKPTELYRRFRNPDQSGSVIASGLRNAYPELFERNEHANSLNKDQLKGLVVEVTGLDAKDRVVTLTCQTFEALKKLPDLDGTVSDPETEESEESQDDQVAQTERNHSRGL